MKNNNVKKGIATALAIGTMAIMCTGCGHKDPPPTEPFMPPVVQPTETVPPLTEAPTEPPKVVPIEPVETEPVEPAKPQLDKKYTKTRDSVFATKEIKLYEIDSTGATIIAKVDFQDKLTRIGYSSDGWTAIEYLGEVVYTESKDLAKVKPADRKTMYTTTDVNMRERADIHSKILSNIKKGTAATVIENKNQWSHVIVNGREGYIFDKYLSRTEPSKNNNNNDNSDIQNVPVSFTKVDETVYAKEDVNVRTGPGVGYRLVGRLQKNESVKRTAKGSNGWSKIMFNGYEYCIAGNYLTTEKPKDADKPEFANDEKVKFEKADENVYAITDVNVRSGPAVGYKQIGVLKKTKGAKRIGVGDNGWSKVVIDGRECFIASKYLTTKNPYPDKPNPEDKPADHEHTYKMEVTKPTCTEKGYTTFTCTICKHTYKGDVVPALGHKWSEWTVVTKPTADKKGQERRQCEVCKVVQNRDIAPIGHTHVYEETVVKPTCTEKGYTLHKCKQCDEQYKDNYVDPIGHKWSEWKITKEATTTEKGLKTRYCTNEGCKEVQTEDIPMLKCEHSYTDTVVKPTCEEDGYTLHHCDKCGYEYKDNVKPKLGHKYNKETTEEPTCDRHGSTYYKCENCGEGYWGDDVPALGHKFGDWKVTTPATPEKDGVETRTCETCGGTETRACKYVAPKE